MLNIGNLSTKIGNKIAMDLNLDQDKKDVVIYGLFVVMQISTSILLTIIVGFIFGVCLESVLVSFTIAIYRKYAGGVHASTPNKCLIIGVLISVIPIFIIKNYVDFINFNITLISIVLIFIFAYYTVYKYAPVDSKQKPIRKDQKKRRLKKGSLIVLCIYSCAVIILSILYIITLEMNYIYYILSISIGILWQTFTLTKTAHRLFKQ